MKSVECVANQKLIPSLVMLLNRPLTPPSLTEEEAERLSRGGEQHGGRHFAHHASNVFFDALVFQPRLPLPRLYQNEDVVHAHRQHQEGNHLPRKEEVQLSIHLRLTKTKHDTTNSTAKALHQLYLFSKKTCNMTA